MEGEERMDKVFTPQNTICRKKTVRCSWGEKNQSTGYFFKGEDANQDEGYLHTGRNNSEFKEELYLKDLN